MLAHTQRSGVSIIICSSSFKRVPTRRYSRRSVVLVRDFCMTELSAGDCKNFTVPRGRAGVSIRGSLAESDRLMLEGRSRVEGGGVFASPWVLLFYPNIQSIADGWTAGRIPACLGHVRGTHLPSIDVP